MAEEAHRIITTIKQMESSLDDSKEMHDYSVEDQSLKVTYPLIQCLQTLKEKHSQLSKIHKERFEQVKSEFYPYESKSFVFLEVTLLII